MTKRADRLLLHYKHYNEGVPNEFENAGQGALNESLDN